MLYLVVCSVVLARALQLLRKSLVVFLRPRFCQSQIERPSLELLWQKSQGRIADPVPDLIQRHGPSSRLPRVAWAHEQEILFGRDFEHTMEVSERYEKIDEPFDLSRSAIPRAKRLRLGCILIFWILHCVCFAPSLSACVSHWAYVGI